jgi:hypothetical protein
MNKNALREENPVILTNRPPDTASWTMLDNPSRGDLETSQNVQGDGQKTQTHKEQ